MIKTSPSRLAAIALRLAAWMPLQASAGILDDDEARRAILDLRAKVDAITRDLNTRLDAKSDKTATLDMLNQHEQTMQEIAKPARPDRSAGQPDRESPEGQKDLYADLDARIKKLEPRQETIDGQTAEVLPSEKQAYDSAMELFKSGDYKAAAAPCRTSCALPGLGLRRQRAILAGQRLLRPARLQERDRGPGSRRLDLRQQRQGAGRDAQHRQQLHRAEGQGRPRRCCSSWCRSSRIRGRAVRQGPPGHAEVSRSWQHNLTAFDSNRLNPYNLASFGSLAQLVEQRTFNPLVAGSNPARPTTNLAVSI
jgi:hypothetical protein